MNSRAALIAGLFASAMATASCGDSVNGTPATPATPTGPSSLSELLLPRLSGNWGGELRLTGVTGGTGPALNAGALACVGAAFDKVIGERNDHTLLITQSGSDLTAKLVSSSTGLACEYTGRIGSGNNFVLHAEQCTEKPLNRPLPRAARLTQLDLVGSSVTAKFDDPINPTSSRGTAAHTYNVSRTEGALVATHSIPGLDPPLVSGANAMNARHSISAAFVLAIASSVSAFAQGAPARHQGGAALVHRRLGGAVSRPPDRARLRRGDRRAPRSPWPGLRHVLLLREPDGAAAARQSR